MPDTPKEPAREQETEKSAEKPVSDLPNKAIAETDAQTVKGGYNYGKIK